MTLSIWIDSTEPREVMTDLGKYT